MPTDENFQPARPKNCVRNQCARIPLVLACAHAAPAEQFCAVKWVLSLPKRQKVCSGRPPYRPYML